MTNSGELLPLSLYQGSANAWECDEMGHLNVRFHIERALAGLAVLANHIAMPRAFTAEGGATLQPLEMHIRFLKEARAGAPLIMRGGVVEIGGSDGVFYLELRQLDGSISSTFRIRAAHVETRTLAPFTWTSANRAALDRFRCALPEHALPRSIDLTRKPAAISLKDADAMNVRRTARSIVLPSECDAFGRFRGDVMIGRVSDAAPWLLADFRALSAAALSAGDGVERKAGGAVVEFRVVFRRWPRAGEHIDVRSAIVEVTPKANRLVHWILDPVSGQGWASVEAIALTFDLLTRKAYVAPQNLRDALAERAIPEMAV